MITTDERFDFSDVPAPGLAGEGPESDGVPLPVDGGDTVTCEHDDTVPTAFSLERAAQAN